MQLKTQQAKN